MNAAMLSLAGLGTFLTISLSCPIASAQTARQVAEKTFPLVVLLATEDESGRPVSLDSAFFVRAEIVATNLHVLDSPSKAVTNTSPYVEREETPTRGSYAERAVPPKRSPDAERAEPKPSPNAEQDPPLRSALEKLASILSPTYRMHSGPGRCDLALEVRDTRVDPSALRYVVPLASLDANLIEVTEDTRFWLVIVRAKNYDSLIKRQSEGGGQAFEPEMTLRLRTTKLKADQVRTDLQRAISLCQ